MVAVPHAVAALHTQQNMIRVMTEELVYAAFHLTKPLSGIALHVNDFCLALIHNIHLMKRASGHMLPLDKAQAEYPHR
jgi:hypothetical protein